MNRVKAGQNKADKNSIGIYRVTKLVSQLCLRVAVVSLGLMVILNALEIINRYFFGHSFFWIQELTLLVSNCTIFLGISVVVYEKKSIRIELLLRQLSKKMSALVELLIGVLSMVITGILMIYSYRLIKLTRSWPSRIMLISSAWFLVPILVASIIMLLFLGIHFVSDVVDTRNFSKSLRTPGEKRNIAKD